MINYYLQHDGRYIICASELGIEILRIEALITIFSISNIELCKLVKDKAKNVDENITFTSIATAKVGSQNKFEFALGTINGNVFSVEVIE